MLRVHLNPPAPYAVRFVGGGTGVAIPTASLGSPGAFRLRGPWRCDVGGVDGLVS